MTCIILRDKILTKITTSILVVIFYCYSTNFLIPITPVPNIAITIPVNDIYCATTCAPVFITNNTGASSISSSSGTLLSGVESISGVLLGLSSLLISARLTFLPKFFSPFIHVSIISTSALSPGCNSTSCSCVVATTPSFLIYQSGLSSCLNSSPSGM